MSTRRFSEGTGHGAADAPASGAGPADVDRDLLGTDELSQIEARLRLTPSERLRYLEDMIAFEELASRARRLT